MEHVHAYKIIGKCFFLPILIPEKTALFKVRSQNVPVRRDQGFPVVPVRTTGFTQESAIKKCSTTIGEEYDETLYPATITPFHAEP
jgi:hypothetical protein